MESLKSELGEELVGKKMKVGWPFDKKFYEGVVKSYCSRKKKHEASYTDGDVENLDLKKERWEIIQDNSSSSENVKQDKEIDLPDSTFLSDIMQSHKAKKSKNVSKNVEVSSSSDVRSLKKNDPVTNSTKLKGVSNEQESREEQNLKSSKAPNAETGRTKGRAEKRQVVTPPMHHESEKDCDDKEETETKGEDSLKCGKESNTEPEYKRDHQDLPDDSNAETKAGGEELKSTNKSNAEPEIDEEEQEVANELIAGPETDREEHKVAKEPAGGEELESMKEPNEEPETEVQERESAKEPTADTKLIEKKDICLKRVIETHTQACPRLVK